MRAMLQKGAIGNVRHLQLCFPFGLSRGFGPCWDWWSDEAMGGGTLGAIGSHAIESFRCMLGAEVSDVFCLLSTHVANNQTNRAEQCVA